MGTKREVYITPVSNQTHNYNQSNHAVFHFDATLLHHSKATLLALKDKGQKQEDGNTVDFLWNTYGKCHLRPDPEGCGEGKPDPHDRLRFHAG